MRPRETALTLTLRGSRIVSRRVRMPRYELKRRLADIEDERAADDCYTGDQAMLATSDGDLLLLSHSSAARPFSGVRAPAAIPGRDEGQGARLFAHQRRVP